MKEVSSSYSDRKYLQKNIERWDEASQRTEERLKKDEGINLPWHYNDPFGEDFKALALRAGGFGAVFFVKSTRFGERIYAAKTLQRFLKDDYLKLSTYEQESINPLPNLTTQRAFVNFLSL